MGVMGSAGVSSTVFSGTVFSSTVFLSTVAASDLAACSEPTRGCAANARSASASARAAGFPVFPVSEVPARACGPVLPVSSVPAISSAASAMSRSQARTADMTNSQPYWRKRPLRSK